MRLLKDVILKAWRQARGPQPPAEVVDLTYAYWVASKPGLQAKRALGNCEIQERLGPVAWSEPADYVSPTALLRQILLSDVRATLCPEGLQIALDGSSESELDLILLELVQRP